MCAKLARLLGPLLLLGALLAACGGANGKDPPKISYGKDVCSRCGMIITEEKLASGLVATDGKSRTFDDPGEMIATVQAEGLNGDRAWVHDFTTVQWIDATTAYYVVSEEVVTPMATGVVAFSTREAAADFEASRAGVVMSWDDMLTKWVMKGGTQ